MLALGESPSAKLSVGATTEAITGLLCARIACRSFSSARVQTNVSSRKFRMRGSVVGGMRYMSLLHFGEAQALFGIAFGYSNVLFQASVKDPIQSTRQPGSGGSASKVWPRRRVVGGSGFSARWMWMHSAIGSTSQTIAEPASK